MLTRRETLMLAGAALRAPSRPAAAAPSGLKIGVLTFGTVDWELAAIRSLGLDQAAGLHIDSLKLASNDAGRIAFLGGGVDTIVSDLLWAARIRGEGRDIAFLPFSATEGALMVPAASPIKTVADLAGKHIGIAGGALDKSWLLLQAFARQQAGLDLTKVATQAFGAPPLLSEKLESGELDAALLYWNFCARLEAKGFRRLVGADEMTKSFGIGASIAFIGYVFDRSRPGLTADTIEAFSGASRKAKQALATQDAVWADVRPLMQASDEASFQVLKRNFIAGIPRRPIEQERADAARLYAILAGLGGEKLVGKTTSLPDGLYWTGA
jgi:NitT/TauT family transport system substrate-binding protein